MNRVSFTGGAQIGWMGATWPFAQLTVTPQELTLSCLGKYVFSPQQVTSFEKIGRIPFFSSSIQIHHNCEDYPAKMVFHSTGNRDVLLSQIRKTGFVCAGTAGRTVRGHPLRWVAIILLVALWNGLFALDHARHDWQLQHQIGPFSGVAVALLFLVALALPKSAELQQFVLKPGRSFKEIQSFVRLLQLISGLLTIGAALALVLQHLADQ
jgi:hypothetical protein